MGSIGILLIMTGLMAAFDIEEDEEMEEPMDGNLTPDPIVPLSSILPDDAVSM